jgi:hypothetical protein
VLFIIVLALAAFLRFWAAPLSAGQDVAQFWAFARIFQDYGLDFYRYADARLDIFPYAGWGFFYPPVWILILGLALLFVPSSSVAGHMIDTGWRIAEKTPIILADLAIGVLIYKAVPGSKMRKLLFTSLWLLHPAAWYESAVFGQFDAIAAAWLLGSVILLMRGKDNWACLLAGLALMTKQHTFFAITLMLIACARNMDKRRFLANCGILAATVILISMPFLLTGNLEAYTRSIFFPVSAGGYQNPLCFAFSGSGALLTYLHNISGWEISSLLELNIPLMIILLSVTAVLCYRRSITPLQAALAGFLIFIALFPRVNYQYLIIYIPLAILQASLTHYRGEKILTLLLAMLPAAWLWLANIPFWFNDHDPVFPWVTPLLGRVGLLERYLPDYVYVSLAMIIMLLSLAYVGLAAFRWHQKDHTKDTPGNIAGPPES